MTQARVEHACSSDSPSSPSSDTKWLSGLYGWPCEPTYASAVTIEPSAMTDEPSRPVQIASGRMVERAGPTS